MLAAAGYLVSVLGPHAIELSAQVRDADQRWSVRSGEHVAISRLPTNEIARLLADYERRGEPLPLLPEHNVAKRLAAGWSPQDPLTSIALGLLARQAGFTQFLRGWIPHLREQIEATLRVVGAQKPFGRDEEPVDSADAKTTIAWTLPLDRMQAVALVGIVRTAAIITVAAVSGMRSSELMELQIGCCRPPEQFAPGLVRYRRASRVVKGQPLGGLADEWVVIEPVYRAAELLEQLHDNAQPEQPLLGRFAFDVRYRWFRNWVNGPAGQRLGLASIPKTPVSLRALRRTLAIELAYRPGGVLAAKIHLKHVAVATTEGYASRPGGAQAGLLVEVNKHESERNLALVLAEFRNYQQGILPAGPGARELTEFFAHVDAKLDPAGTGGHRRAQGAAQRPGGAQPAVQTRQHPAPGRRELLLVHRPIPGTVSQTRRNPPRADKPLAGMCDSARCPQATHHLGHRDVWAKHAETTKTFLGSLGPNRKIEKVRLQADHQRARRVLDEIDTSTTYHHPKD